VSARLPRASRLTWSSLGAPATSADIEGRMGPAPGERNVRRPDRSDDVPAGAAPDLRAVLPGPGPRFVAGGAIDVTPPERRFDVRSIKKGAMSAQSRRARCPPAARAAPARGGGQPGGGVETRKRPALVMRSVLGVALATGRSVHGARAVRAGVVTGRHPNRDAAARPSDALAEASIDVRPGRASRHRLGPEATIDVPSGPAQGAEPELARRPPEGRAARCRSERTARAALGPGGSPTPHLRVDDGPGRRALHPISRRASAECINIELCLDRALT